ncbi:MAG: hypothetical protein ACREQQ_05750, partial [Candidatus Binatia bacterium]
AVSAGLVRLTGSAPSHHHRLYAATVARRIPGVRAVKEELQVTSITETRGQAPPPATPRAR